jgi:hypothetical protein
MKEPYSVRMSDAENPSRGEQFERVMKKRAANAAVVLRELVDAYIRSDGNVTFPVRLESQPQAVIQIGLLKGPKPTKRRK